MTQVVVNSNTYSDDRTAARDMNDGGHTQWFFPMVSDTLVDLAGKVTAAETHVGTAETYADAAAASAASAVAAPGTSATSTTSLTIGIGSKALTVQTGKLFVVGMSVKVANTSSPTNWMHGDVTAYDSGTGALTVNVTSINGSGTVSTWTVSISAPGSARPDQTGNAGKFLTTNGTSESWAFAGINGYAAKTGAYTLVAADKEKLIDCTSGTFTLSFTAAATLADGWAVYLRNSGTGDITLDPDGSEQIDGLSSYIMYPGEVRLVFCDGTGFKSVVLTSFYKTFTASGTFTKPPGYSVFSGLLWSAGASGDKGNGRGGGGGGCAPFTFAASALSATEAVTIGAGGAAVTTAATNGNAGGNSTFSTLTVIGGGSGDNVNGGTIARGGIRIVLSGDAEGFGSGTANVNAAWSAVWGGGTARNNGGTSTAGGASVWGGGSGGNTDGATTGAGGSSTFGGAGGAASVAGSGTDGSAPAGGGGATETGTQSGAGARGELRIWGGV